LLPAPTVPATAAAGSRGGSRWVGRVAAEASLVPFPGGPVRACARTFPFGVSHQAGAWPRSLSGVRRGAGARPVSGGSSRGPKSPGRFRSARASGQAPPPSPEHGPERTPAFRFGLQSKQAPIFGLSASERSKLRSSAASSDLGDASSQPARPRLRSKLLGFGLAASRSRRTPILRHRLQRASPLSPAGPSAGRTPLRFRSGPQPEQAPVRTLRPRFGGAIPASVPTVAAPFAEASGAAGRLPEIRPRIRFRLCWSGFFHRPASGVPPLPFEGKRLSAFGRFGSGSGPFPGPLPSVHEWEAVMDSESRQADSACG
jgi:hypothetical protein